MFRIDRPIARISSSLVLYQVTRIGSFTLGEEIVITWTHIEWVQWMIQNLPMPARGPWQQWCDTLHCHGEWWGSVPPSALHNPWKHSCVLRPCAVLILIQEHCSSFVNMVLWRSHYPYESHRSTPRVCKSRYWGVNASVPLPLLEVTRPPYFFSGELCTSPFACLCTPCAVGPAVSASLCSEHVNETPYLRSGRQ